ncbi:DNA polymerase III subunit delta [Butyrivibrio sp. MC2013]|uniref:DNA polymerase III subunit delta n=1 Tax=Butyrivibrio sp. MC2013 TaxID=1280686 RepID=UPI0004127276|nr:DNA polymerase III subunit delta [Butyrivibrio sp. MC2013]
MPAVKASEYNSKYKQIVSQIGSGAFVHAYLVYGDEAYLRCQVRDKLKDALLGGGDLMNYLRVNGKDRDVAEIIDFAETMPFFADRRVVVVEDSGFFKDGSPELSEYLKAPSETAYFVFVESKVDKRKDIFKTLSKSGFTIECTTPSESDLRMWIAGRLRKEGIKITAADADHFIETVGTDMFNEANELEKLISYVHGRDVVTREDIDEVCAGWLTSQIFAMTDAVADGDQKKAVNLYYDLLALKEPSAKIQALIFRQFNMILQVSELKAQHYSSDQIASMLGSSRWIIDKYIKWSGRYSIPQLRSYLRMCVENDEAIRSGRLSDIISVEMILIKCSQQASKGA